MRRHLPTLANGMRKHLASRLPQPVSWSGAAAHWPVALPNPPGLARAQWWPLLPGLLLLMFEQMGTGAEINQINDPPFSSTTVQSRRLLHHHLP